MPLCGCRGQLEAQLDEASQKHFAEQNSRFSYRAGFWGMEKKDPKQGL